MITRPPAFNHLRPSSTPEMLDRSFSAAAKIASILLAAGFVYGADHLLSIVLKQLPAMEGSSPYVTAAMLLLALLGDYAAAVAMLALFQGLIFPRRPLSPKALFRTAFRKLPSFFLTHLLYLFMLISAGTAALRVATSGSAHGDYVRIVAGLLCALVGLWFGIRFSLATVVALIEEASPFPAFVRSRHLTARRAAANGRKAQYPVVRWCAGAILPLTVALTLVALFLSYAVVKYGIPTQAQWKSPYISNLIDLFAFAATLLALPLYWTSLMALYVEYRMRYEALDFYLRLRELRRKNGDEESPLFKMA